MHIATWMSIPFFLLAPAAVAYADDGPAANASAASQNIMSTDQKRLFQGAARIVVRAAELMPEEGYAFRPADSVRTFGQIVGHVADSQYAFCSAARGEKKEPLNVEKTKTSKADLLAALKEAFAYCTATHAAMTDASGVEIVKFMGSSPRLGVLSVNTVHTIEHYGNLVTYLRMKNLVPPTSDPEFMKQLHP